MITRISTILHNLSSHPKKLFLTDSMGALLSAFFLAGILAPFEDFFGMPCTVLYFLASLAGIFSVYSIFCYFFAVNRWRLFLKIIAFTNLSYCFLTFGLVIYFYEPLTVFGLSYFFLEIMLIIGLVVIELRTVYKFAGSIPA